MKLTISKSDLITALQIVRGTTSSKPILPIGEYARLEAKGGKLTIVTTDFQGTTVHTIDYSGDDFCMLLPVNWFIEFLKELAEQPVTIELVDQVLKITTVLNGNYEIPTENAADFSKVPNAGKPLFTTNATELKRALFAVGEDDLRPQFIGVAVSEKTIRASDSYIIYSHSHTGYVESEVMFPKRILSLLPDYEHEVSITKNNVCFSNKTTSYHTTLVDAKIPAYDGVIPDETTVQFAFNRLQLLSALKRLKLFANQVKQAVRFDFVRGEVRLSAADIDLAKNGKEIVNGTLTGDDLSIAFNGVFFQNCLNAMDCEIVYLNMTSKNRGAVLRDNDSTTDKENLIMIMPCVL